ncbi:MAG: site-2 protease family protein [Magnetospirillum sp.]|nr:site-2 protease family protein [Magnetospirillum sp.]
MFGSRLTLFDLFGFKVRIDASWLLLAALIVWSLAVGYFPFVAPGFAEPTYWAMGLAGLGGLALSIVVHELAHSLVARRFNLPITGITLFIFGGVAEMSREPSSPKGEFFMAIAGPLTSVAIAVGAYGIAEGAVAMGTAVHNPAVIVFRYLAMLNGILAAFNMIPAFPLDGGRVLRSVLWAWRKDVLWATRMAAGAGSLCGFALMALGVWSALTGALIAGIWWFFVGLFVRTAAVQAVQQQMARRLLTGRAVSRLMRSQPVTVPPDASLSELVENYVYRHTYKSFPVVAGDRLVGCVTLDGVRAVPREEWPVRRVADVMESCAGRTIPETADAADALARMQGTGLSRLMVTRGGALVGVLSLRDLMHFLAVKGDLEGQGTPHPGL